jgi:glutathione S-transferase
MPSPPPAWRRHPAIPRGAPIIAGCSSPPGRWKPLPTAPAETRGILGYGDLPAVPAALEGAVSAGDHLAGGRFSAADLHAGAHLVWGMQSGGIERRPAFEAYADRLRNRPAAIRAKAIDDGLAARAR